MNEPVVWERPQNGPRSGWGEGTAARGEREKLDCPGLCPLQHFSLPLALANPALTHRLDHHWWHQLKQTQGGLMLASSGTQQSWRGPSVPGRGERADPPLANPMESASPALSIRATASRNKQNKHPGLGQAGKGRLTHSRELHPLPRCFVWRIKTVGVGACPCLTTILLSQFSPEYCSRQWVFVFLTGAWEEGGLDGNGRPVIQPSWDSLE